MTGHPRSSEGLEAIRSAQSTSIHFSPPIPLNPPQSTPILLNRPNPPQSISIHFSQSTPIHRRKIEKPRDSHPGPGAGPRARGPGHWLFGTPTTSPGTNLRRTDTPQNKTLSRGAGRRTSSTRSPTCRVATRPRTSSTRSPTSLERSWSTPKRQDTAAQAQAQTRP